MPSLDLYNKNERVLKNVDKEKILSTYMNQLKVSRNIPNREGVQRLENKSLPKKGMLRATSNVDITNAVLMIIEYI